MTLTRLESCLVNLKWVKTRSSFTANHEDHAFVMYTDGQQTWIVCIAPCFVETGKVGHSYVRDTMTLRPPYLFKVPATPQVISAVVHSAIPALHLEHHPVGLL
jgi:hypothetical protein